jgi:hypothetical protein
MFILQPRRVYDNEFNRCRQACRRRSRRGAQLVNREIALIAAAFAALGLLVGNLTGLSASPIAKALIPALFTLIGGSFVAFISKVQPKDRSVAASAILSFSISCLIGTYIGIALNGHELLGPRPADLNTYLRDVPMGPVDSIDQRKRNGQLNAEQAYEELRKLVEKK